MQVYEIGYLILPSIPEEGVNDVVGKITSAVTKAGGNVIEGENPFKQDLSYSMSKIVGASRYVVSDAYFGWMKFELDPSAALEVKDSVEKVEEVLRFLLIKAPRESQFTFAKAKAAVAEKMAQEAEVGGAEEAPRASSEAVVE